MARAGISNLGVVFALPCAVQHGAVQGARGRCVYSPCGRDQDSRYGAVLGSFMCPEWSQGWHLGAGEG